MINKSRRVHFRFAPRRANRMDFAGRRLAGADFASKNAGGGYFGVAEKRLSNELACTIGCEPATVSFAAAAGASESDGFNGGRADACLVSAFGDVAIFVDASGRCGSWRLASLTLGLTLALIEGLDGKYAFLDETDRVACRR